jgi:hypothetical protein
MCVGRSRVDVWLGSVFMTSFQASISGAVLTSLLNEVDHSDFPSFGILYGSYQMRIRQIMSDTHENGNLSESILGMTSLCLKSSSL